MLFSLLGVDPSSLQIESIAVHNDKWVCEVYLFVLTHRAGPLAEVTRAVCPFIIRPLAFVVLSLVVLQLGASCRFGIAINDRLRPYLI